MTEILNTQYIEMLKGTEIYDEISGIKLAPFNGSETSEYNIWFDRQLSPEVLEYLHPNTPFTIDPNQRVSAEEFIRYVIKTPNCIYYRIEEPAFGFIGHLGVNGVNYKDMSCSLSYVIGNRNAWGAGIATKVVELVIPYLKNVGFKQLKANAHTNNIRSRRILSKYFRETYTDGDLVNYEYILS